ncbi:hypothetical protein [Sphingopyxis solisilvae]|uniref:hypothetical protein n=1 Tax=Sphingopyxis solisilvae TaxID=1886788 RepID=UPI001892C2BC|nr:hypothetical protein [Sphingopyxis solisilvae]
MLAPNSWLRDYAPGYRHLERPERRAVSDFVMLWSVYEAQVLDCNASAQKMLDAIERWHNHHLLASDKSDESWTHFVERLRSEDGIGHRFAGLKITNVGHKDLVRSAVLAEPPGPDQLTRHSAMAIIIHRIRNNLLHGEKWSYGLRDQADNFRHASHMLMLWMDMDRTAID